MGQYGSDTVSIAICGAHHSCEGTLAAVHITHPCRQFSPAERARVLGGSRPQPPRQGKSSTHTRPALLQMLAPLTEPQNMHLPLE